MTVSADPMTPEELTAGFRELRKLVLGIRYELGEPGDGKRANPIHRRIEKLEDFNKRQAV